MKKKGGLDLTIDPGWHRFMLERKVGPLEVVTPVPRSDRGPLPLQEMVFRAPEVPVGLAGPVETNTDTDGPGSTWIIGSDVVTVTLETHTPYGNTRTDRP